ncbi:hypothetical protein EYF80_061074 [Liparis tanakae]|uniref:Uncharacterized protein n=1 Tax=Liparis tanakae TaxID=230148 RepID=A0A4Z2EIK4_9TELE|nr:hypothetical protein EYF80_061074 [Liparis tanakae]
MLNSPCHRLTFEVGRFIKLQGRGQRSKVSGGHRQVLYSVTLELISSRTRRTALSNSASSSALASRTSWLAS